MSNFLKSLTPAETMAVVDHHMLIDKLVRNTLFDLLFRQVINIERHSRQASSRDPETTSFFVMQGENFSRADGPVELRFTGVFAKSPGIKVLLKNYIHMLLEAFPIWDGQGLRAQIAGSKRLEKCFFKRRQLIFITKVELTAFGSEMRKQLSDILFDYDDKLEKADDYTAEARRIVREIGSNLFVLKNLEFNKLEWPVFQTLLAENQIKTIHDYEELLPLYQAREEVNFRFQRHQGGGSAGCTGYTGCGTGCGGDSGCSGCSGSGCSGCSGCGGGD